MFETDLENMGEWTADREFNFGRLCKNTLLRQIMVGCLENSDLRPQTLENSDPPILENSDLENSDPLQTRNLRGKKCWKF